jgi:hypothetical protein
MRQVIDQVMREDLNVEGRNDGSGGRRERGRGGEGE